MSMIKVQHFADVNLVDQIPSVSLAAEEVKKLEENVGSLISTNGCFSTSQDINVTLIFTGADSDEVKSVLFEVRADPRLKAVVFADIDQYSSMRGEKEVLFSLGAVFKIDSIQYDAHQRLWVLKMTTSDYGSKSVYEHLKLQKKQTYGR
ncbi:unnamed protein product [Didymodactylos carnosus]|nr:unnamed protein product [Didymodactylos carnosus]CAF4105209.1 unnamed protein product [Didymodactylos carnosus]